MSPSIAFGRILWVRLGPRGKYKKRPAVAITAPDLNGKFLVLGGSNSTPPRLRPYEVELPHCNPRRHPLTKLRRRTVVDCKWVQEISITDVLEYGGRVPPVELLEIAKRMLK